MDCLAVGETSPYHSLTLFDPGFSMSAFACSQQLVVLEERLTARRSRRYRPGPKSKLR